MPPQYARIANFSGGINQSLPAEEIADNELSDAINFELDALGHATTRRGFGAGYGTTPGTGGTPAWDAGDPGTPFEHFPAGSSNPTIIIPKGDNLYSFPYPAWDGYTDITGALSLPSGAKWQWVQMDDAAIGVNGANSASGKDNTIQIATAGGTATAISGAPRGKYIEYWNRRIFIVDPDDPDSIVYCAVGDHTDWTTTGASGSGTEIVGNDEYGPITGLKAWQGRLFIFKLNAIYMLVPGAPAVDNRQWQIVPYATNVGCVSAWTIQQVGDDIVFLSAQGVTTLRASGGGVGEFAQESLSLAVPSLSSVPKADPELYTSVVWPQQFQYWVGVPETGSSTPTKLWVLDYRRLLVGGAPAWMPWDGDIVETKGGYCVIRAGQAQETICINSDYPYELQSDSSVFEDAPEGGSPSMTTPFIATKAFNFDAALTRKEFYHYGIVFEVLENDVDLLVTYLFDENWDRSKSTSVNFSTALTGSMLGGSDQLDSTFTLQSSFLLDNDFVRSFRGSAGRRGKTLMFRVSSDDADRDGFVVRRILIKFDFLNQGQVGIGDA